jgi:heat shock protein HtpX
MNWQTDWGLRGRMLFVSVLLLVTYLGLAIVLVEVLGGGVFFTVGILAALSFAQYYYSGSIALRSMGAREVSAEEYPELHRIVTRLAQQADAPQPTVAVADTKTPNAFAAGRSPDAATVCVTTGLLSTLDQDELEGVIAHELAHIKNRDVAVMTIASFFASIAFLVVRWGWLFGGGRNRDAAPIWVAILVSLVVWVVSFFLIRALSRYREHAADRGAAQITGDPAALASALRAISDDMERVPQEDLREQAEMNAFFILPIKSGFIGKLARTHPSTERRIERLQGLQREL